MREKIYTAIGISLIAGYLLHKFTPLDYFIGKQCNISFDNDVVIRYMNKEKARHRREKGWVFKNIKVLSAEGNRICFSDYSSIKWGIENEHRKAFPVIAHSIESPLLTERSDGSFCVKKSYVRSISHGFLLGWTSLPSPSEL